MISVCMATYNGSRYIKEQLDSILVQLGPDDEVIISDDSSTDETLSIIASYADQRIKLLPNQHFHSPIFNFENALKHANGDYIFLSDQDDVWESNKVEVMMHALQQSCLVVSDCSIVDANMNVIRDSFCYNKHRSSGIIPNIIRNNFLGCCMAFHKELLKHALPFPKKVVMHDIWLGICASAFYSVRFIPDKLIKYRRHGTNASAASETSKLKLSYRVFYRLQLFQALCGRTYLKDFIS